jgi:tRNA-dihydrouridine synthase
LVAQIWGLQPENYYKTAQQIADGSFARELGLPEGVNFAGVDINMGCPEKTVVKNGACSGLIHNRELAVEIIQAVQEAAEGLPVSVKTRLGFNEIDASWPALLLEQKLNMLTIHARTRKEMSKVPAHWDEFSRIVQLRDQIAPDTLIVGNGDIQSRAHGLELAKMHRLDGIMIGRGVFHDPFAFSTESPWSQLGRQERIDLYVRHVELFAQTWKNDERPVHTLNKFCKIYINGFDGAKDLREQLMQAESPEHLLSQLKTL